MTRMSQEQVVKEMMIMMETLRFLQGTEVCKPPVGLIRGGKACSPEVIKSLAATIVEFAQMAHCLAYLHSRLLIKSFTSPVTKAMAKDGLYTVGSAVVDPDISTCIQGAAVSAKRFVQQVALVEKDAPQVLTASTLTLQMMRKVATFVTDRLLRGVKGEFLKLCFAKLSQDCEVWEPKVPKFEHLVNAKMYLYVAKVVATWRKSSPPWGLWGIMGFPIMLQASKGTFFINMLMQTL